jgi:hypothetical protein
MDGQGFAAFGEGLARTTMSWRLPYRDLGRVCAGPY